MSKLDDIFGAKKPKDDNWQRIEINVQCGVCSHEADEVYIAPDKKHIKTIHTVDADMHIIESELDLTWLPTEPS